MKFFKKNYFPAMLGTAIEYYDISLYGYMAPILTQIFLPKLDKLTAYFYYFTFEVLAALCQIVGSYYFGKMGDREGRKKALFFSMFGTSIITFLIVIIPTYNNIGIYAALLFALCRAAQSFFLGGEYNGGAIYCLEHEEDKSNHIAISGLYGASTVFGVLIAALVATLIMQIDKDYFRLAYCLSLVFAITTYFIRLRMVETPEFMRLHLVLTSNSNVKFNKIIFFSIILASILSGILYGMPTRIVNVILPIALDVSPVRIMTINCFTIVLYMFFLAFIGVILKNYSPSVLMKFAAILIVVFTVPAIALIETKQIIFIIITKVIFAVLSAFLIAPLHAWTQSISQTKNRYLYVSTAYSIGKLGAILILPLTIILFEKFNNLYYPAFILVALSISFYCYITLYLKK